MTKTEALKEAQLKQEEIMQISAELENKKALYKAFTKAHFGIADGETTNVLEIVKTIIKVSELPND
jgi:hypothetical protein